MPAISVIVPLYNVERFITRCLESIVMQSFSDCEIILVDDGCTDKTVPLVTSFLSQHPNLDAHVIAHERNMGLLMARRTGYLNATGRYIVFLDSDDYLPSNALNVLYHNILDTDYDVIIGAFNIVKDDNILLRQSGPSGVYNRNQALHLLLNSKLSHSLCGRIFNASLFLEPEYLPHIEGQINSEDLMLTYTLTLRINKTKIISEPVYNYFYNQESSSKSKFTEKQFVQILRATNYLSTLIYKKNILDEERLIEKYLSNRIISLLAQNCPSRILHSLNPGVRECFKFNTLLINHGLIKGFIAYVLWTYPVVRRLTQLNYK